jgi:hypothetical protein
MSVETKDFVDIIVPVLEAGTWTNLGSTPKITTNQKAGPSHTSRRHAKNVRVEVKNTDGAADDTPLTFNGTPIYQNLSGEITIVHTDKQKRNYAKTDLQNILKAGGISFSPFRIANNPSRRNKDMSTYFLQILNC